MEEQNIQQTAVQQTAVQETVPQNHKKILYAAVGFSLLAVVLLAVVLVKIIQPGNPPAVSQGTGQNQEAQTNGTDQKPLAGQTATAPVSINNSQDLNNALKQIDSTDLSVVETDLNQNTSDASQFSQ